MPAVNRRGARHKKKVIYNFLDQFVATLGAARGLNGLVPTFHGLIYGRNANGSALANTAAGANDFLVSLTAATSEAITGHAAQANTKTDTAYYEVVLPQNFIATKNITITLNGKYSGAGTVGATKTIAATAYKFAKDGTMSANLVGTAAVALTTSNADAVQVITGTTLNPGDRILVGVITSLQETGGASTLTAQINSVQLS